MGFLEWAIANKWIIAFYLAIVLGIYIFRSKFEFQAKFIALLRTKIGLKLMDNIGKKHTELVKLLGYIGIGAGFLGMLFILIMIGKGTYDMAFVPNAPPVVSPVIPGVPIPGSPVFVPFWFGIIALFFVVVVHEFSHGVVARAHNIKVHNSGIVFFGPIIGAFVEPDEKQVEKQDKVVKYSIYAAGPFSNMVLAGVVLLLLVAIFNPVTGHFADPIGVSFSKVEPNFPAETAGLVIDETYTFVNDKEIKSVTDFEEALKDVKVGETIVIGNEKSSHQVTTTSRSENPEKAVIGVNVQTEFTNQDKWWMKLLLWFDGLLTWIFILSIGLGLANLLPIGPIDGGRMIKDAFESVFGDEQGKKIWLKLSTVLIVIILILLIIPIAKATLPQLVTYIKTF